MFKVDTYSGVLVYRKHLKLFVLARWGVFFASLLAAFITQFVVEIDLNYLAIYACVFSIPVYNAWFQRIVRGDDYGEDGQVNSETWLRGHKRAQKAALVQIVTDLAILSLLLHLTGGFENPFVIFYSVHIVMATVLLSTRWVLAIWAGVTIVMFLGGICYKTGVLDHAHIPVVYGTMEPVDNWAFVLGMPFVIAFMNLCLLFLTYQVVTEIGRRRDAIFDLSTRLEQKNEKLRLLDGRRQKTMAVVSHDMKSPLDAVSSYLLLMDRGYLGDMSEKQADIVKKSLARLKRLRDFISDVLDWQTIEKGELRQDMKPMDLVVVIRQIYDDYLDRAAAKSLKFVFNSVESCEINGAKGRLHQVFDNLVSNAVKYTLDGGTVEIAIAIGSEFVSISVIDTGIGMSKEDMAHLFEDFFRSVRAKKDFEGTGLGMSVVRRILEAHHGDIQVHSEENVGTTCVVRLPLPGGARG